MSLCGHVEIGQNGELVELEPPERIDNFEGPVSVIYFDPIFQDESKILDLIIQIGEDQCGADSDC